MGVPEGRRGLRPRLRVLRHPVVPRQAALADSRVDRGRGARPGRAGRRRARARGAGPRLVRARRRGSRARSPRCCGGSTRSPPHGLGAIRLLYLYPSEVRDPLVATMLELPTVVPYFDLSLQHADARLLRRMKRWGSGDRFLSGIDAIRAVEPDGGVPVVVHRRLPRRGRARARRAARVPARRPSSTGRGSSRSRPRTARPPPTSPTRSTPSSRSSGCASARRCRSRSPAPRATPSWATRSTCSSTRSTTTARSSAAPTVKRRRSTASSGCTPTGRGPVRTGARARHRGHRSRPRRQGSASVSTPVGARSRRHGDDSDRHAGEPRHHRPAGPRRPDAAPHRRRGLLVAHRSPCGSC